MKSTVPERVVDASKNANPDRIRGIIKHVRKALDFVMKLLYQLSRTTIHCFVREGVGVTIFSAGDVGERNGAEHSNRMNESRVLPF